MKLPKRVPQHISETASFKLFMSKMPNNWIIRDISERDYGIDCYLELVNDNNELTGELALIQLKARQKIPWTKEDNFVLSGIDISTSNYWFKFSVPVFIFLADIETQELYFLSVDYYIKRNFGEFATQTNFNYLFKKANRFEGYDGVFAFKFHFYYEHLRLQFENQLLFFLTNLQYFINFQLDHGGRDFHLGVEEKDLIYFEAMHRNYDFLCIYFNIDNPIPSLNELRKKSKVNFGIDSFYELYEHDLAELMPEYKELTLVLIKELKSFLHGELTFWLHTNPTVYNYVVNLKEIYDYD